MTDPDPKAPGPEEPAERRPTSPSLDPQGGRAPEESPDASIPSSTEIRGASAPESSPRPTLVFGVLGGIASGKSVVARLLAGPEGLTLSADHLAHEILASPELRPLLLDAFGPEVFNESGEPDRRALAARVFAAPEKRRRLEGWIHPRVRERILALLAQARESGVERIVLDVPLLLENDAQHGFVELCDHLVFVDAPGAARRERAVRDRDWSAGEVERRESQQLPLDEKRRHADHVIDNHGSLADLEAKVAILLRSLGIE